jgi:hypothetical protein
MRYVSTPPLLISRGKKEERKKIFFSFSFHQKNDVLRKRKRKKNKIDHFFFKKDINPTKGIFLIKNSERLFRKKTLYLSLSIVCLPHDIKKERAYLKTGNTSQNYFYSSP